MCFQLNFPNLAFKEVMFRTTETIWALLTQSTTRTSEHRYMLTVEFMNIIMIILSIDFHIKRILKMKVKVDVEIDFGVSFNDLVLEGLDLGPRELIYRDIFRVCK